MQRFLDIVKKYPLWIGGAVIGIIILVWLSSRSKSDAAPLSGGVINIGPSEAQLAANAQITNAQIAAQADAVRTNAMVELGRIQANVVERQSFASRDTALQMATIMSTRDQALANVMSATELAGASIAAGRDVAAINASAGVAANANSIAAGRDIEIARMATSRDMAEIQMAGWAAGQRINSGNYQANLSANRDVALANAGYTGAAYLQNNEFSNMLARLVQVQNGAPTIRQRVSEEIRYSGGSWDVDGLGNTRRESA